MRKAKERNNRCNQTTVAFFIDKRRGLWGESVDFWSLIILVTKLSTPLHATTLYSSYFCNKYSAKRRIANMPDGAICYRSPRRFSYRSHARSTSARRTSF
ncbi:hypothetical protein PMI03_03660 [Rhizobium sp. AP16]|nr:hypothetical protein PMI03_03660 [Rhizobium sp. AP16]